MSKIYALEGAVLSCLAISYLVARASLTQAPLEDAHLIPGAVLGIFVLVCVTVTATPERVQRLYFHVIFGFWFSMVYGIMESFSVGAIQINPFTASISLAFLTVQTLIAAAAVSETMWRGIAWADVSIILVTWFQACVNHETPQLLATAAMICFVNSLSILILFSRLFYEIIPESIGTGGFSLQQILEILSASLKGLNIVLALALAYTSSSTTWALPVALAIPMAFVVKHTVLMPAKVEAPVDQPNEEAPPTKQQEAVRMPEQGTRPPPYNSQLFQIHIPAAKQPAQQSRPTFFNQAMLPTTLPAPRLTPDALLFKNTRALINVTKKNS